LKPRTPTQADCDFWGEGATIGPMRGDHVGATNIEVIRQKNGIIRVPWVLDDRDNLEGLKEGFTVWTTFYGGMYPMDAIIT